MVGPAGLEPATRLGGGSCQCAALNRGREDGFVPLICPTCQMSSASPEASLPATAYFAWGCFRYFGLGARPRRSRGLSFPVMIFPDDDRGMACRTMASGPSSDGGGRRTRTFEAIRRLIYSQLPLPLGTLPRLNLIANPPAEMATDRPWMTLKPGTDGGLPVGRFMGMGHGKVNLTTSADIGDSGLKLP